MTAKWWWVTWPRGHQERYGGRSYRQLKRMHELQPFPLERPFGNDVQASRSDLLDERDAANAAAAAEKAAHISAAEESRRAALKTQPRAGVAVRVRPLPPQPPNLSKLPSRQGKSHRMP